MPIISAVVATLNRTTELEKLFNSVLLSNFKNIELIIVDQNKQFLIEEIISLYRSRLNIVHVKMKEANQSKARNYGATLATGSVLCFPDDDCWFEEDTLDKVINFFEKHSGPDLLIIHWKQNPVQGIASGMLSGRMIRTFKAVGYTTYVMFFKKDKFILLGGFLETIGIGKYIGCGEDSELLFRAAQKNFTIYYDSSIDINHTYISVYNRDLRVLRARQRAMGFLYFKYPVTYFTLLKGMIAPFLKLITSPKASDRKKHLQAGIGRWQGFFYGYKNRKNLFGKE